MCVCVGPGIQKARHILAPCQNIAARNGKGKCGFRVSFLDAFELEREFILVREFVVQNDELYVVGVRKECLL